MALTKTPICDFNLHAIDFKLKSVENTVLSLNDINLPLVDLSLKSSAFLPKSHIGVFVSDMIMVYIIYVLRFGR